MGELTAGKQMKIKAALEETAATLLGKMMFEFSRLDSELGLCVVWTNQGREIEALTKQITDYAFHRKLEVLANFLCHNYAESAAPRVEYTAWLDRAHIAREKRNEMVHSRWYIDPIQRHVVSIIGLPTAHDQREVRYTVHDLKKILNELLQLQIGLSRLRTEYPL